MTPNSEHWQAAYQWLCRTRSHAPTGAGVWHLRFHWGEQGARLQRQVERGDYRLSPMRLVGRKGRGEERLAQWSAQDALVLKWVALRIEGLLPTHARCAHLKGHGGGRESVRQAARALASGEFNFVYRTDIRGYYRHIRKEQLLSQIQSYVADPVLHDLLRQYLYYSVEDGGEFHTPKQGICRSCPLSPLFGASLLYHVDAHFSAQEGIFYSRYMDDFLLLTRTRWPLRRSVKQLHQFFNLGGFETHPDKTQLGRIEQGFDWLGVEFSDAEPCIAARALSNHHARRLRLYEQARRRGLSAAATHARVQAYEARWKKWAAGLLCTPTTDV
ncbi:transposase [Serratia marcescens]